MNQEILADIPGFPRYAVSNYGRIWNKIFEMQMQPSVSTQRFGHLKISLIDENCIRRSVSVARLVAQAFVEPPNPKSDHVILKDGDLHNVAAPNLEWRTRRQAWLYRRQMQTPPNPHWQSTMIRNVDTGVEYNNVVHCGIIEGLLFEEIMESALSAMNRPPERIPVYPHGHCYEFIYRV